jgi:hypothetical protein
MSSVPSSPDAFFSSYIPARFAELIGFEHASSAGNVVFTVPGVGAWAYWLTAGKLLVAAGARPDTIVTITIPEASFEPIVVAGATRLAGQALSPERQLLAFRALTLDAERVSSIRSVAGSVSFAVISCESEAFWGLQSGSHNPIELLMGGKLRIAGDAQIPMALSSLFV